MGSGRGLGLLHTIFVHSVGTEDVRDDHEMIMLIV